MTININAVIDEAGLTGFHLRVLALCGGLVFLDGFDLQAISYAAPALARGLALDGKQVGLLFSAGQLGLMLGALVFGLAGDRWGRKRVFVLCGLIFGLASLAMTQAAGILDLLGWRLVAGLGLGGATPLAITIAADFSPRRVRAALTMVMYCSFTIGGVCGGIVNAAVMQHGWQAVFYIGGALPLLLAPVLLAALPESLNYLVARGDRGAEIARILRRLAPGRAIAPDGPFAMADAYAREFHLPALFREGYAGRTLLLWSIFFIALIALFGFSSWLPSLLSTEGLSPARIVTITGVGQGFGLIGTIGAARLIVGRRPFLVAGLGYGVSAVLLLALGTVAGSFAGFLVVGSLMSFCLIGTQNIMNAMSGSLYPPRIRATGVGWAIGIGRAGGVVGPALGGVLVSLGWAPGQLVMLVAMPATLAGGLALLLARHLAASSDAPADEAALGYSSTTT